MLAEGKREVVKVGAVQVALSVWIAACPKARRGIGKANARHAPVGVAPKGIRARRAGRQSAHVGRIVGKIAALELRVDGALRIGIIKEDEERGALGMHYTSVPNILKVLNPLFLDDLRTQMIDLDKRKTHLDTMIQQLPN